MKFIIERSEFDKTPIEVKSKNRTLFVYYNGKKSGIIDGNFKEINGEKVFKVFAIGRFGGGQYRNKKGDLINNFDGKGIMTKAFYQIMKDYNCKIISEETTRKSKAHDVWKRLFEYPDVDYTIKKLTDKEIEERYPNGIPKDVEYGRDPVVKDIEQHLIYTAWIK